MSPCVANILLTEKAVDMSCFVVGILVKKFAHTQDGAHLHLLERVLLLLVAALVGYFYLALFFFSSAYTANYLSIHLFRNRI